MKKLALIIASYNCKSKLQVTLDNVMQFNKSELQVIVIDGSSTDGTAELLYSFSKKYDGDFQFISEPDTGIANAWNKGVGLANAKFLTFLNCGDFLATNYLNTILDQVKSHHKVYYCDSVKFSEEGEILALRQGKRPTSFGVAVSKFGFAHPGCVMAKSLILDCGGFNENKRIAIDTHLLLQCFFEKNLVFEKISTTAYFETGGISDKNFYQAQNEYYASLIEITNFNRAFGFIAPIILTCLRKIKLKSSIVINILKTAKHVSKRIVNTTISFIPSARLKTSILNLLGAHIGEKTTIGTGATFTQFSQLNVGSHTIINANCYIDSRGGLQIGNNVNIMRDTKILTAGHNLKSSFFELQLKSTTIGSNAVIFSNVLINPGVDVGNSAVILPYSNVVCDIPDNEVWGGNPAKYLFARPAEPRYKNNYFQVFGL